MKRTLGLLDANQGNRHAVAGLVQRQKHTERANRAVGHVLWVEPPWVLGTVDMLPELDRLGRTERLLLDVDDTRRHLAEILDEPSLQVRKRTQPRQHARDVGAIALQQMPGIG